MAVTQQGCPPGGRPRAAPTEQNAWRALLLRHGLLDMALPAPPHYYIRAHRAPALPPSIHRSPFPLATYGPPISVTSICWAVVHPIYRHTCLLRMSAYMSAPCVAIVCAMVPTYLASRVRIAQHYSTSRCMRVLVRVRAHPGGRTAGTGCPIHSRTGPALERLKRFTAGSVVVNKCVRSLCSYRFSVVCACSRCLLRLSVYLHAHHSRLFFCCLMAVWGWCWWRPFKSIPFSAFWLRSCVVSVLISLIAYMVLIEDLRLTSISRGGVVNGALAHRLTSMVAVLHYRCSRAPDPFNSHTGQDQR